MQDDWQAGSVTGTALLVGQNPPAGDGLVIVYFVGLGSVQCRWLLSVVCGCVVSAFGSC